mmetsp:Transcript_4974/g.12892  ORF Transcript_4974/g.12892 Transcript_4974/m.12892 type:complete len:202 (-) Transcript_4974:95-700(-)
MPRPSWTAPTTQPATGSATADTTPAPTPLTKPFTPFSLAPITGAATNAAIPPNTPLATDLAADAAPAPTSRGLRSEKICGMSSPSAVSALPAAVALSSASTLVAADVSSRTSSSICTCPASSSAGPAAPASLRAAAVGPGDGCSSSSPRQGEHGARLSGFSATYSAVPSSPGTLQRSRPFSGLNDSGRVRTPLRSGFFISP